MTPEIIHESMSEITSINSLTLTGGEPSLVPEVIEEVWLSLFWKKISVGFFYIVSNGLPHNKYGRFLAAVHRLYGWCDEQGACALTISKDQYHPRHKDQDRLFEKYWKRHIGDGEDYYGDDPAYFRPYDRKERIEQPLTEGNALKNNIGVRPAPVQNPWATDDSDVLNEIYISANGNVTSECNMSFHRIDKECVGNVLKTPLSSIIASFSAKVDQKASF